MLSSKADLPQKSLQIKKDDKFFSKLLAKEGTIGNTSSRVYYGVASVGVPFMWESQPGTPKHKFSETSLPPLTPPPSYHFNSNKKKPIKKASKSNLLNTIFPKLSLRKTHLRSSSSSSSHSSSSYSSSLLSISTSSTPLNFHGRSRSLDYFGEDEDHALGSPTSTLCFGDAIGRLRGCHSMVIMKKALSSIVGHGSGLGTAG